jgi:hypothetical protein
MAYESAIHWQNLCSGTCGDFFLLRVVQNSRVRSSEGAIFNWFQRECTQCARKPPYDKETKGGHYGSIQIVRKPVRYENSVVIHQRTG